MLHTKQIEVAALPAGNMRAPKPLAPIDQVKQGIVNADINTQRAAVLDHEVRDAATGPGTGRCQILVAA